MRGHYAGKSHSELFDEERMDVIGQNGNDGDHYDRGNRYSIEFHDHGAIYITPYFSRDLLESGGGFTWKEIQEFMQDHWLNMSLEASTKALSWETKTEEEYFGE